HEHLSRPAPRRRLLQPFLVKVDTHVARVALLLRALAGEEGHAEAALHPRGVAQGAPRAHLFAVVPRRSVVTLVTDDPRPQRVPRIVSPLDARLSHRCHLPFAPAPPADRTSM